MFYMKAIFKLEFRGIHIPFEMENIGYRTCARTSTRTTYKLFNLFTPNQMKLGSSLYLSPSASISRITRFPCFLVRMEIHYER